MGGENQEDRSSQVVIVEPDTNEEFAQTDLVGKSTMESILATRDEMPVFQVSDDCWISPPDSGHSVTYADSLMTGSSPEIYRGSKALENGDSNAEVHHALLDIGHSKETSGDTSNLGVNSDVDGTSLDLSSLPASSTTSTPVRSQQIGLNSSSDKEPSVFAADIKLEHHVGADASSGDLHRLAHPREFKVPGTDTATRTQLFKGISTSLDGNRFEVPHNLCGLESYFANSL